ncbi:MAG: hypothetical protein V1847_01530 [Candidatus Diapherotrites archaeon]
MPLEHASGLNPFQVFSKPRNALQGAFDFPNYIFAIGLILLQWVLLALASYGFGLKVDFTILAFYFVSSLLTVIVSGAFIAGMGKWAKSKEAKFSSIFTALSLLEFIKALSVVLAVILLVAFPVATDVLQQASSGTLSQGELYNGVLNAFLNGPLVVALLIVLVAILLGLYSLYLLYLIIDKATESTVFKNLVILVLSLVLSQIVVPWTANSAFQLFF